MELLILADDMTGALDSSVQLAQAGFSTLVVHEPCFDVLEKRPDLQVLAVNMETRHKSPQEAYRIVYDITRRSLNLSYRYLYKKADSTLRGNIGGELAAVMDATGKNRLYFAPAYPRLNRLTIGGRQFVDGQPLSRSVYAGDPFNPVSTSSIAGVIAEQTGIPVLNTAPKDALVEPENAPERAIVVIDASSNDDLQTLGHRFAGQGNVLLGGSAGFSGVLPDMLGKCSKPASAPAMPKTALVVCGSLNANSMAQVNRAAQQGVPLCVLTSGQKQAGYASSPQGRRFHRQLGELLAQRGCVVLQTCGEADGVQPDADCLNVADNIGQMADEPLMMVETDK